MRAHPRPRRRDHAVMNRRAFPWALALGATVAPLGARAVENAPKVALLFIGTPDAEISGANPTSPSAKGLLEGMRELGWIDGQNTSIERISAKGDLAIISL
jgi:hypothetical protein